MRFFKIIFIFFSLIFLNGCLQTTALLGPGVTIATTGNVLEAGFQYGANSVIEKETGWSQRKENQSAVTDEERTMKNTAGREGLHFSNFLSGNAPLCPPTRRPKTCVL